MIEGAIEHGDLLQDRQVCEVQVTDLAARELHDAALSKLHAGGRGAGEIHLAPFPKKEGLLKADGDALHDHLIPHKDGPTAPIGVDAQ